MKIPANSALPQFKQQAPRLPRPQLAEIATPNTPVRQKSVRPFYDVTRIKQFSELPGRYQRALSSYLNNEQISSMPSKQELVGVDIYA